MFEKKGYLKFLVAGFVVGLKNILFILCKRVYVRAIINQAEYFGKPLEDNDNQFTELLEYSIYKNLSKFLRKACFFS